MNPFPQKSLSFFWSYVKKQPLGFGFIFITCLIWPVNETLFPYFIKVIINVLDVARQEPELLPQGLKFPVIGLVSVWLLMEFAMRTQGITTAFVIPKFKARIREQVFAYTLGHSPRFFANHFAGSIANKISDLVHSSERLFEILFFNFISIGFSVLLAIVILTHSHPIFGVIMTVWCLTHFGILALFLKKNRELASIHAEAVSSLSGKVVDSLTNVLNVRLFARKPYEEQFLAAHQNNEIQKARRALFTLEKMKFLQGLASTALIFSMTYTLLIGWEKQWVTLGDISLVSLISFNMLGLVWFMSYQISVFIRESGKISSALNLINTSQELQDLPHAEKLVVKKGDIQFEKVSFGYMPSNLLFNELSTRIRGGKKIGLVGFSGSGKTTFVNLILRFYDLQSGAITIDEQNIAGVTQTSLHEQITVIPQEPLLFHRSLMENIRYGRIDASDEEVIVASKQAYCHEFITPLEKGYDTLVGDRGIKLSGGQRQRIAIARAILKNAPILILDEATSALDSATEKDIQTSLHHLMQNRTTLVIAHRLSTLSNMDEILVFDQGRIVEQGTIHSLLENTNGHFTTLWQLQQNGLLPEQPENQSTGE